MKFRALLALISFVVVAALPAAEPVPPKSVIIFVHGAWGGAWQFKKVAPLLEDRGFRVCRATLTGLGERMHLASPDIGLATHIDDVANLIRFEDLRDVTLIGHSYGGMVITGVADRLPDRIRRLIYLDAALPVDGESMVSLGKSGSRELLAKAKDGFIAPWWLRPNKPYPKDVPHPVKTLTDAIQLSNPTAAKIPGSYLLTVEKGQLAADDDFYPASLRAKARGWPVIEMEGNHNPHWFQPEATVEVLLRAIRP